MQILTQLICVGLTSCTNHGGLPGAADATGPHTDPFGIARKHRVLLPALFTLHAVPDTV